VRICWRGRAGGGGKHKTAWKRVRAGEGRIITKGKRYCQREMSQKVLWHKGRRFYVAYPGLKGGKK